MTAWLILLVVALIFIVPQFLAGDTLHLPAESPLVTCRCGHRFAIAAELPADALVQCPKCRVRAPLGEKAVARIAAEAEDAGKSAHSPTSAKPVQMAAFPLEAFRIPSGKTPAVAAAVARYHAGLPSLDVKGAGQRRSFTASTVVTCPAGHAHEVSLFGLDDRKHLSCPICATEWTLDESRADALREELLEAFWNYFADRDEEEPDEDVMDFILERGRFPKKGEIEAEPDGYTIGLVGESFRQDAVRKCREGERVALYREPDNPHDGKAIAAVDRRGEVIGYIPRDNWLHRVVWQEGQGAVAKIFRTYDAESGERQIVLDVSVVIEPLRVRKYVQDGAT